MPLFDFHCGRCGHVFEDIAKADDMPACPKCGNAANRQLAAPSSLTGKARSALPGPTGHGCCGSRPSEAGCVPGSCCGKA
ncbi:FmdB family zinc ribbon protein [Desulfocurvibacter africanus]|uniref:FmdB family zinc ribbon protein n=1 Tax=Desulfocurvibacter africanus TaxID=873 RepID=UPI000427C85D|nr:FmdB family zinc ribbon protein [Desulfocurvibacter africanus]